MSNNITSKDKFSNQEFLREDSPKSLHEFSYTKNSYENLIELSNILQSNLKIDMIHNYNTFLVKNNIDINITDYIKVLNKKSFNIDINFIDDFLNCVDLNDCCINSNKLSKHNISTTEIENIIKLHNLILNKDYKISTVHDISGDGTYINYKVYYLHPNVFKLCLLKNYHLKYIQYYMFLEQAIKYYNDYQIMLLNNKVHKNVFSSIILNYTYTCLNKVKLCMIK